jgi:hypothetical protein
LQRKRLDMKREQPFKVEGVVENSAGGVKVKITVGPRVYGSAHFYVRQPPIVAWHDSLLDRLRQAFPGLRIDEEETGVGDPDGGLEQQWARLVAAYQQQILEKLAAEQKGRQAKARGA